LRDALRVEVLARAHRPLLGGFRNQQDSLVQYLKRFALRHTEKDLLARTYVAVDETGGSTRIAGYFSLAAASVERSSVARLPHLDGLPRFPIPAVLIARLAVDSRVQGQGLGGYLFEEALGLTLQLARAGPLAFRVLVTDAIDARAVTFYGRFGLERLSDDFPCRMVLDLKTLLA
jgi:GNAT superfamily N-acetyltransferase